MGSICQQNIWQTEDLSLTLTANDFSHQTFMSKKCTDMYSNYNTKE